MAIITVELDCSKSHKNYNSYWKIREYLVDHFQQTSLNLAQRFKAFAKLNGYTANIELQEGFFKSCTLTMTEEQYTMFALKWL